MSQDAEADDLEKLGREAAQLVAGEDAVEQVEVVPVEDSLDRPAYHFWFLIDQERARLTPGLVLIRLTQQLRGDLLARGDEAMPIVRILDRADWDKRGRA